MYTNQINAILSNSIDPSKCHVLGTFPRNLLPISISNFPSCFVANTDVDSEPGEHWVAYYFPSEGIYEFFDSYGESPLTYDFPTLSPLILSMYNTLIYQSLNSNTCGHFCLYFLHYRSLGFSFDHIQNSFSKTDLKWNDKYVRNLTHRYLYPNLFTAILPNPNSSYSHSQISKSFNNFKNRVLYFKNKY